MIPATGHKLTAHLAVAATCTEPGNSAYWSCACGKYFSDAEGTVEIGENSWLIPATGHAYGQPTYHWEKEGEDWKCTAMRVCGNNASHEESETVTATGVEKVPATCIDVGEMRYTATFENLMFEQQTKDVEVPATGHQYENGICTFCGKVNPAEAVASINRNGNPMYFVSIEAAWAAAVDGDAITLLEDCTIADYMSLGDRSLTVDLNGNKLTGAAAATPAIQLDKANTALAIEDSVGGGELISQMSAIGITADNTSLTISGGKVSGGFTNATTIVTSGRTSNIVITGHSEIVGNSISGCISIQDPDVTLTLSGNAKLVSPTGCGICTSSGDGSPGEPAGGIKIFIKDSAVVDAAEYFVGASMSECFQIENETLANNGCPEQCCVVGPTDGYYTYAVAVAKANDVKYPTFTEAAKARTSDDDVIILLADGEAEYKLAVDEILKVALGGHALKVNAPLGYDLISSEDSGVTTYSSGVAVAEIVGGSKHMLLQEAMDAAAAGDTVRLLTNVDIPAALTVDREVALDLNGKTIARMGDGIAISVNATGKLTILDSSREGTGKIASGIKQDTIDLLGELILESGAIEHSGTGSQYAILIQEGASFTMNGGTVTSQNKAICCQSGNAAITISNGIVYGKNAAVHSAQDSNTFVILGGTFTSDTAVFSGVFGEDRLIVSGGYYSFKVLDEYCADGYIPTDEDAATGLYTVEKGWTVTFDLNNGTPADGESYESQKIPEGMLATQPADPIREGQTFVSWVYLEKGVEKVFDFTAAVDKDYDLTAKWKGDESFSWSLALEDGILVKFGMKDLDVNAQYKVQYSFDGSTTVENVTGVKDYTLVAARCATTQMTKPISITVEKDGVEVKRVDEYSIRQYCLNKLESNTPGNKLYDLCYALLNYGGYAQVHFGYDMDNLAYAGYLDIGIPDVQIPTTGAPFERSITGKCDSISKTVISLSLQYMTMINFCFTPATGKSIDDLAFYVNGVELKLDALPNNIEVEILSDGRIDLRIKQICAKDLDTVYTVAVTDGSSTKTIKYSVMTFVARNQDSNTMGNACKAFYKYYLAVKNYMD